MIHADLPVALENGFNPLHRSKSSQLPKLIRADEFHELCDPLA